VDILYLLIPLAMILLVVMAAFFFWSVKSGQMDDLEGPAYRILMDDDLPKPQKPVVSDSTDESSPNSKPDQSKSS
jgi:cbb3-type cytochrome oxidase maturation protein